MLIVVWWTGLMGWIGRVWRGWRSCWEGGVIGKDGLVDLRFVLSCYRDTKYGHFTDWPFQLFREPISALESQDLSSFNKTNDV
jgi:hypothetical protein